MARNKRNYDQFCGLARALDFVGERWTLLIVRDLLLGPKRYSDILAGLPGLTTNLLARRLQEMEAHGLIEKAKSPPPAPVTVYRLTPLGNGLESTVLAASEWGNRFLIHPTEEDTVNLGWSLLRLKSRYKGGHHFIFEFQAEGRAYHLIARHGGLQVVEGEHPESELIISGTTDAIHRMFFGAEPASSFPHSGRVSVSGKVGRWPWLLAAFGLR